MTDFPISSLNSDPPAPSSPKSKGIKDSIVSNVFRILIILFFMAHPFCLNIPDSMIQ